MGLRRILWFAAGFIPRMLIPLAGIPGYDTLSVLQLSQGWTHFPAYELKVPLLDTAVAWAARLGADPLLFLTFVLAVANGLLLSSLAEGLGEESWKLGILSAGLFLTTSFSPKFSVGLLAVVAMALRKDPKERSAILAVTILLHQVSFVLASFVWALDYLENLRKRLPSWKQPSREDFLPAIPILAGSAYYMIAHVRAYWAGALPNFFLMPSIAILLSVSYLLMEGKSPRLGPGAIYALSAIPLSLALSWASDSLPGGSLALLPGIPVVLALPLLSSGRCRRGGLLAVPALTLLSYGLLSGSPALTIAFNRGVPLLLLALVLCPVGKDRKLAAAALAAVLLSAPLTGMALNTSSLGRVEFVTPQDLAAVSYACSLGYRVVSDGHFFQIALRTADCRAYPGLELAASGEVPENTTIVFSSRMLRFVQVPGTTPSGLPPDWADRASQNLDIVYSSWGAERILVFRS